MANVTVGGTTITFEIAQKPMLWDGYSVGVTLAVSNQFIPYTSGRCRCDFEDVENLLYNVYRLIAGGHRNKKETKIEGLSGCTFILDPIVDGVNGIPSREFLRAQPYKMDIRFPIYNEEKSFCGDFTCCITKDVLKAFALALHEELEPYLQVLSKRHGKYMLVGVSPQGYKGCNYWYFDSTKKTRPNTFVWVKMGKHDTLQIVYVDSVRCFDEEELPCSIETKKRILKQASAEDLEKAKQMWKE